MARFELERITGSRKAEAAFLATSCIISIVYRGWNLISTAASGIPGVSHISYDGVYYAEIARNILSGSGFGWEAMIFPVLQPILVAGVSFITGIGNVAFLAQVINLVAGALLLVPSYLLAREIFGAKPAVAAVLILIPYPQLASIATGDTAESLYSLLVFLSLLAAYKALSANSGRYMFVTGLCMGAAYLARPEGLLLYEVIAAMAAWRTIKAGYPAGMKGAAVKLGLLVAGFSLLALPYVAFLTKSYGRVVVSPKLPYESVVMKNKVFGDPLSMTDVDGIAPSGRLMWQEKGGAGLILGYFRDNPARFVRVYLSNLESELPWRVMNSTHMQGYPIVYPLCFWIPAIIGFWLLFRRRDTRWKAVLVWAPFVNLFLYPIFTKGFWIYHAPYVPGLVIFAVGGYQYIAGRIKDYTSYSLPLLLAVTVLWAGYSIFVRFSSNPESLGLISYRTLLSDESMKAGEQAKARLGDRAVYMMDWSRLVYYLGGRWVELPAARPYESIRYGVSNGADYMVEELVGERSFEGPEYIGVPGLSLAYEYTSKATPYTVLVWKINKAEFNGEKIDSGGHS